MVASAGCGPFGGPAQKASPRSASATSPPKPRAKADSAACRHHGRRHLIFNGTSVPRPEVRGKPVVRVAHREGLENVVIIVQRQGKLLEVVGALNAAGGLAR